MDQSPSSSTYIKIYKIEDDTKDAINFDGGHINKNCSASNLINVDCDKSLDHLKAEKENLIEKQRQLQQENQDLDVEIKELRKKLTTTKQITPNQELEILKKCFSPGQIRILQGQSKSRWSLDDLGVAFTIKSFCSREFYIYLRRELKFPLPAESNINRCYRSKNKTKKGSGVDKIKKTS